MKSRMEFLRTIFLNLIHNNWFQFPWDSNRKPLYYCYLIQMWMILHLRKLLYSYWVLLLQLIPSCQLKHHHTLKVGYANQQRDSSKIKLDNLNICWRYHVIPYTLVDQCTYLDRQIDNRTRSNIQTSHYLDQFSWKVE